METNQRTRQEWEWCGTQLLFKLRNEYKEFTADDFYSLARAESMPPAEIKRLVGSLFRQFASSGYLKKTNRYRLSSRNGSTPLPVWEGLGK